MAIVSGTAALGAGATAAAVRFGPPMLKALRYLARTKSRWLGPLLQAVKTGDPLKVGALLKKALTEVMKNPKALMGGKGLTKVKGAKGKLRKWSEMGDPGKATLKKGTKGRLKKLKESETTRLERRQQKAAELLGGVEEELNRTGLLLSGAEQIPEGYVPRQSWKRRAAGIAGTAMAGQMLLGPVWGAITGKAAPADQATIRSLKAQLGSMRGQGGMGEGQGNVGVLAQQAKDARDMMTLMKLQEMTGGAMKQERDNPYQYL